MTETNQNGPLAGKVTLLTGAASGIGAASARLFAAAGARLVLADRDEAAGQNLTKSLSDQGYPVIFQTADVARREDNERLVQLCLISYGRLDNLFCNAGINLPKLLPDTSDEEIEKLLAVNVKGLFYATRAALPVMLAQGGGAILITASKTGLVAQRDSPVYCATKGAAVMLAKALALDYATHNIRVNALCPGIIDTPMVQAFARAMPDPAAAWAEYSAAQPMGRLGTPEECAQAALWLLSDAASFITGVALPVDGGFTAM